MEEQMPQNIPPTPQDSLGQAPVVVSPAPVQNPVVSPSPTPQPAQTSEILTGSETLDAPAQRMTTEASDAASITTQAQMTDVNPDDDPEVPHEGIFANRLFRKVFFASALLLGIVLLLAVGGVGFQRFSKSDRAIGDSAVIAKIGDQNVAITQQLPAQANTVALRNGVPTVVIGGDLAVQGLVQIVGAQGTVTLDAANVTGNQKITLPNASGEICLSTNNCNFAAGGGAATTVIVQGVDPNTIDGGVTSLNGSKGAVTLQGTTGQVSVTDSGSTLTFGLPQNIGPDSSPQFTSINLSTVGTQNGFNICDSSNNCNFASTTDAIVQGGNAFDAVVRIGARDNFGLDLLTNNTTRLSITNNGGITIGGSSQDRLTITSEVSGAVAMVFQGATDDVFTTTLAIANPTAPNVITLPNASGTICLSSGTCSGAGGYGDVLNGGNNFNALMTLGTNDNFGFNLKTMNTNRITISNTGNIALLGNTAINANVTLGQNSSSRLSLLGQLTGAAPLVFQGATDNSFATSLLVEDPTANRTILLPNADGTICLSSGNCEGPVGTGDVLQGGNNFGATMVLGPNDNFGFNLKTNNTVRLSITDTGNATFSGDLNVQGNVVLGTSTGNRVTVNGEILGGTPFIFQGATDNSYATYFMVADPTANRSIILPNADGVICLSSSTNCGGGGGAGDVLQGGNNFNSTMLLGTNDNFGFNFKTNNTDRVTISNTGLMTVLQDLHVNGSTVLGNDAADNVIIQAGNLYAPNNLNIDTYTQYIDTVHDQVGFGTLPLGTARVGILATNGGDGLTVNLGSSAGNVLNLQDNGVNVMTVADGGATTLRNSTNSTGAFQVQNAVGASLVNVDSTNNAVSLLGNNSGETSAWQINTGLPASRFSVATATANGYVYVIGGSTSSSASNAVNTSYYAKMNTNGTVGAYTATTVLPTNRTASGAVVANGYVYLAGGSDGTSALTTTIYAKLNADGTLGTWQTSPNVFPSGAARADASIITANGYIYVIGGSDGSGNTTATTLYAKLNADGTLGTWQTSPNVFPSGAVRRQMGSAVANGYVYILGGTPTSSPASVTYSAKLNTDGTIGAWATTGNNLPKTTRGMGTVVANGYIYVLGGETGGGVQSDEVYYSRFGNNGALGAWTLAANRLQVSRFFNSAVTFNGYIYSVGGGAGTYYASLPRVQVGGSLDLVGLQGQNMADGGDFSQGSTGGSLTAGNGVFVGTLQVQGQAEFASSINVAGNLSAGGQVNFKNSTNSASAFQIQNAAGTNLLGVDTNLNYVQVGSYAADSASTLLVLDTKNTTGDPASAINGAMYYNSFTNRFRCYQGGVWTDCIGSSSGSGDITQGGNTFGGTTAMTIGTLNNGGVNIVTNNITTFSLTSTGAALFKNASNSVTAFQIQNAAGASLVNVDSSNNQITLLGNNSGEVRPWSTATSTLPANRYGVINAVTANGYMYVIGGGVTNLNGQSTVYYARANTDGSPGAWATTTALPDPRASQVTIAANGYIYVIGGTYNGNVQSTVYYAKVNADGTLGTWGTTNALPGERSIASSAVANGYVYIMGGADNNANGQSTVYYAKLNADGTLGAWNTNVNVLPANRRGASSVVANGYVYVIGNGSTVSSASNTVYYAKLNADGSTAAWSTAANALPDVRWSTNAMVSNGYVYVIGGANDIAGTAVNTVYYSRLNADGSVGTWSTAANALPDARYRAAGLAANGYMYVIGGRDGTNNSQATVYYTRTSTLTVAGNLDLVGIQGQDMADPGSPGLGATGGALTAGNGTFVGTLQVQGQVGFANSLSVAGDLNIGGQANFRGGTNSTLAFQIQNAAGTSLFTADTTNSTVTIGGPASASPALFVLSTKNTTGDPASTINGSMYYNSNSGRFRCYQNNVWTDCIGSGMGTGDISQGGNSFGVPITIGTNDGFAMNFETGGITRVSVSATEATMRVGSSASGAGKIILDDSGSLANEAEIYSDNTASLNFRAYANNADINMLYGGAGVYGVYLDGATGGVGIGTSTPTGKLHVLGNNAASPALIVQGASSQTANLLEVRASNNDRLAAFGADGQLNLNRVAGSAAADSSPVHGDKISLYNAGFSTNAYGLGVQSNRLVLYSSSSSTAGISFRQAAGVGAYSTGTTVFDFATGTGTQTNAIQNASNVGLVVRGAVSQTANLQEWQDNNGNRKLSVSATGALVGDGAINFYGGSGDPEPIAIFSSGYGVAAFNASLYAEAQADVAPAAVFQGAVGQTADLLQLRDSDDNVLTAFDATGNLSIGLGAASTGAIRLENGTAIYARNAANNGDIQLIGSDASDNVTIASGGQQTNVGGDLAVTGSLTTGTPISVTSGGTGAGSFTQYGLLFGNGTGTLQSVPVGNSGQCLTGNTGNAPTWGTCTPGGTGDIKQGGNDFGGTTGMTLGTINNGGVNVITNNVATFKLSGAGAATFQNSADSASAFQIQNTAGTSLFNVDSTNSRIYIGNATPDGVGTLLVLDNKNTGGDPAGVDGGMYYNSSLGKFRCYENGEWKDCIANTRSANKPSDQTFSGTSYTGVSGLSFGVVANQSYRLQCTLLLSVPVGTNGGNISTLGPTGPAQYTATFTKAVAQLGADTYATSSTFDDTSAATSFRVNTTSTGSNRFIISYDAILNNGGSAGTWQLRAKAADGSSSITFYANSSCDLKPL